MNQVEIMKQAAKETSKSYPIAEIFSSPQGEGGYAGTYMTFIRLAGCTVGKPFSKPERLSSILSIYTEKCTLYDGREFPCDTDYRKHGKMTAEEIIQQIPSGVDDVCITGGEPMMHDLFTLITYLHGIGRKVHIETSGTIHVDLPSDVWVTVSPKFGILESMLQRANEVKILVDKSFKPEATMEVHPSHERISLASLAYMKPVFLQPVNYEKEINAENMLLCMEHQIKYPSFRVSPQMHKAISMIIKQEVR